MPDRFTRRRGRANYTPTRHEVASLIERAEAHVLGTDFLMKGSLDSVAATFGVHAFTVTRARDHLSGRRENSAGGTPS